ncbi:MAG TPA: hypothetical protein VG520_00300 [Candidatus Dormibacteraeota bacterium]|nr:hypothetical protein [Candidatus Dormibacteraeota bacterium]
MVARRLLGAAALSGLAVALAIVAGWPDIGRSLDLVTGNPVSGADALAFIGLLCWLTLAVLGILAAVGALRRVAWQPGMWCAVILTAGSTVLITGIARHQGQFRVCCASAASTHRAEQLVH